MRSCPSWREAKGGTLRRAEDSCTGGLSRAPTTGARAPSEEQSPAPVAAALQIVDDLRQIGILADPRAQSFSTLLESTVAQRGYDALLIGITGSGDPDPYALFHSSEIADQRWPSSGRTAWRMSSG
ncbi:MAG TPA: hypothetical protein VFC31_02975 [Candidatus Limnocylindria bacterium]|nr:hypothetical protein [Candidatus Limnocylindria bacterium]